MITKEDIKNLADLSRIEVSDEEAQKMTKEIDSILGYVSEVQNFSGESGIGEYRLKNVLREDIITNEPNQYKEKLLENAPARDGDYLEVKKIL